MINVVGVAGCGIMGSGIAQICAQCGYQIIVSEKDQYALENGLIRINNSLTKGVEQGQFSQKEKDLILNRINGTSRMDDFKSCDLVIEAIPEKLDLKIKFFKDLVDICPEKTILATNTSALSISEIGMAASQPDRIIGLHFFNPAYEITLIEMVVTEKSNAEVVRTVEAFGKSLGKTVILSKDSPGFIVNRLVFPFILNAIAMLENGVASLEDIDNAVKLGLNHPMGPLALADFIGLDLVYDICESLYIKFNEPQYAPPALLEKMVAARQLGRKTGQGFYNYQKNLVPVL